MASVYDSTGKGMGSPSMTTEQVMGMIRSMSEGKVGPAKPHGKKTDSGEATRKLQELFAAYFADYSKNVDETKKHTAKVLQYLKELDAKRENKKRDKQSKLEGEQTKNIGNLTKHALRKGSLYTHDVRTEAALIDVQKAIQKTDPSAIVKEIRKGLYSIASNMDAGEIKKSIGRETGKKSRVKEAKGSSFSHNHIYEEMLGLNAAMDILSRMKGGINKLEDAFLGMNTFQTMFKGIIKEEVEFTTNIRAAAYEIDGITEKTHGLQRQYEKIGLTVAKTGVDRSTYEKEYLKNVKKGIKEAEKVKKLTTAQLNTERMIGVEAGSLGDNFTEWHESLGMNTGQVEEIGRGMRDVAKFTGVTGTNLTKAVQSSEAFLKNMRNAGTLTAMAAKNIMELSANAQKLGVADAVEPLLKAMTSSTDFYLSASKETQAFLVNAAANVGKIDKLTTGTIMHSKKDMKEMSKGMRMEFERIAGMSMEEFDKLDAESKMRLNIVFKTYTGMEGGQLKRVIKAAEDSSKGYADRLGEINKKLGMNISMEEKKALEEQKRQLQLSASMSVLNELNEAAEGTDNMAEALSRFNDKSGELSEEMSALGITATDSAGRARQAFEKSLENINAQRTAHGKKAVTLDPGRIERALKNKDEFKMLQDHLAGLEQEAGIASKTKAEGPVSEIKQNVMEINDHLRDMTQGGISKLFNSMAGKLALIALTVVSIAATLAIMAAQSFLTYKGLQSAMGRLGLGWGKGGAKAGAKAGAKGGAKAAAGAAAAGGAAAGGKAASKAAAAGASKIKTVGDLWKVQIDGIVSVSKWAGKKITTAFEGITSAVSKGASLVKSGGISAAKGIGSGFRGAKAAVGGLTMAKVGTGLGKGMRGLAQVPNMMAKGAGAVAGGAKAAALGLGKLAAKLNPLGLIITAVIAGVDGLIRAFDAADRAGQIFGKAQEDVTMSEEYAAKSAGLLIGVLDSLTFGILGMIAPLDEWTDALARFFEDNKIFTIILAPIVVTLEVIWGLIKGIGLAIWEILKGIWDGIKNILQPIWDGLKEVFSMIGGMFGATEDKASGLTKAFREFGGVVGLVSKPIKWIGQAIGWIFKQIGALIGWILKVIMKFVAGLTSVFEPVVEVFKAMWEVISDIGGIFSDLWDLIKEPIMEIYNFFSELFGGGGGGFMDGVKQFGKIVGQIGGVILRFLIWPLMIFVKVIGFIVKVVRGVIKMFTSVKEGLQMIKDGFMGLIDGILWPFRWLYDVLVGHSIVPDLVEGIVMWFLKLPIKVLKALGGLIASIAEWIWDTLTTALSDLGDWIWDNIIGGIGDIGSWLWDTIVGGIGNIGSWIWDNIVGGIKNIGTWLWDNLTGVFKRIVNFIIDLIPGAGALLGSEEENKKREAESGPSMLSGGARFLGGLATLDTGKMWGGVKETAKGAWEGTKRVVRNLNPMNWFDEGSTQILNDGVAMLHKGEQVIPAPVAESGGEFPKTLPPSNQQTQLQQNRASSQAMTPGELQQIAENSNQEVTLQQEMRDLLQQLVNQAKQGGGGAAASEGSGSNILSPFVKYWEWYTGHHKQTAAKAMK